MVSYEKNYGAKKSGFSILGIIYLDKVCSEQTSQKEMIPGSLNTVFSFSLDSPNFFFIILLSSYKLSPPNDLS
jgi:hypothetical protein